MDKSVCTTDAQRDLRQQGPGREVAAVVARLVGEPASRFVAGIDVFAAMQAVKPQGKLQEARQGRDECLPRCLDHGSSRHREDDKRSLVCET